MHRRASAFKTFNWYYLPFVIDLLLDGYYMLAQTTLECEMAAAFIVNQTDWLIYTDRATI